MNRANPLPDVLEALHQWEPHIHAFEALAYVYGDADPQGPLSGITVGIKDNIDVAGLPTRNGSDACSDALPAARDAPVVAALRGDGARIIGKTTTTEFAFTDPTACRNPHDLRRSPGGSSSGSGAAVAAGVIDVALGTQTAGSLCRPAAYCGVVGFKPTYGILPTLGVTPLAPSFDTIGIIAGSVALAQAVFETTAPPDVDMQHAKVKSAIYGLWETDVDVNRDTMDALHDASGAMPAAKGSALVADVDRIVAAHRIVMNFEAAQAHHAMLSDARVGLLKPKFLAGLRAGETISPTQASDAAAYLADAKRAFWQHLADVDIVLTLPVPDGAPLINGTTGYQDWLTPWTVFGGPLVCIPWGHDRLERPRSVMLAGHPDSDAHLLAMAAQLETCSPPRVQPQLP